MYSFLFIYFHFISLYLILFKTDLFTLIYNFILYFFFFFIYFHILIEKKTPSRLLMLIRTILIIFHTRLCPAAQEHLQISSV